MGGRGWERRGGEGMAHTRVLTLHNCCLDTLIWLRSSSGPRHGTEIMVIRNGAWEPGSREHTTTRTHIGMEISIRNESQQCFLSIPKAKSQVGYPVGLI